MNETQPISLEARLAQITLELSRLKFTEFDQDVLTIRTSIQTVFDKFSNQLNNLGIVPVLYGSYQYGDVNTGDIDIAFIFEKKATLQQNMQLISQIKNQLVIATGKSLDMIDATLIDIESLSTDVSSKNYYKEADLSLSDFDDGEDDEEISPSLSASKVLSGEVLGNINPSEITAKIKEIMNKYPIFYQDVINTLKEVATHRIERRAGHKRYEM